MALPETAFGGGWGGGGHKTKLQKTQHTTIQQWGRRNLTDSDGTNRKGDPQKAHGEKRLQATSRTSGVQMEKKDFTVNENTNRKGTSLTTWEQLKNRLHRRQQYKWRGDITDIKGTNEEGTSQSKKGTNGMGTSQISRVQMKWGRHKDQRYKWKGDIRDIKGTNEKGTSRSKKKEGTNGKRALLSTRM